MAPGRLRVGINIQDNANPRVRVVSENDTDGNVFLEQYSGDAACPTLTSLKARGTAAAPANVQQEDRIVDILADPYSGGFMPAGHIRCFVDAPVSSGQRPATRWDFATNENNAAARLVAYLSREGYLGVGVPFNPSVAATRAAHIVHVVGSGEDAQPYVTVENYETARHARFRIGRAKGTFAVPASIASGDTLGSLEFWGYTNQWHECSEVASMAEGTIVAGTTPDSALLLNTTFGGNIVTRVRVFSTGRVGLGDGQAQTVTTATNNGLGALWIAYNDGTEPLALQRASANAGGPVLYFRKSRGTLAIPAMVSQNDELMYIQGNAYTNGWHDNLGAMAMYVDAATVAGQRPATRIAFRTQINNAGGPSDRMVIYSGGTVLVGPGTVDTARLLHVVRPTDGFAPLRVQVTGGGASANVLRLDGGDNSTTGSLFAAFHRPDGTQIGSISQNAAATVAYNTSSDARLKENIADMGDGLALVLAMRPRRFNYITDVSKQPLHGFIAQELHAVFPEAVTPGSEETCECRIGEEDAEGKLCEEHEEGCYHMQPWGVDYGKLTPVLARAIQELDARLRALEN